MARSIGQRAYSTIPEAGAGENDERRSDPTTLYIASVFLQVRPSKRPEVLSAMRQVIRIMRMSPECLVCRSYAGTDDENTLVLVSEWSTHAALENLLESQEFLVLRGMRMLLQKGAALIVDEVSARTEVGFD
jgi:quinol monooxygenase YgiN